MGRSFLAVVLTVYGHLPQHDALFIYIELKPFGGTLSRNDVVIHHVSGDVVLCDLQLMARLFLFHLLVVVHHCHERPRAHH